MTGAPVSSLTGDELALLLSVVEKGRPDLGYLVTSSRDLTRAEVELLIDPISEEIGAVSSADTWEPDSYGTRLEKLLDRINRHLMP